LLTVANAILGQKISNETDVAEADAAYSDV
jgi:hypothetical protein